MALIYVVHRYVSYTGPFVFFTETRWVLCQYHHTIQYSEKMFYRRSYPLIICFLIAISAIAQGNGIHQRDSLNHRDLNNEKQGHWIIKNQNGKYKGYSEGQLVEEGEYVNNRKSGTWTKYYPNGNMKHELTFANNVANGYAKIYYRSGQLQEEGVWKVNRWIGDYNYYYEDGNKQYSWSYNSSGKREGEQVYYHENGTLKFVGDWANGQEAGELKEYYADGSLKSVRQFDNGKIKPELTKNIIQGKDFDGNEKTYSGKKARKAMTEGQLAEGYNKVFNADGTVSKEGLFKKRKLINGKSYIYKDGIMIKVYVYANGVQVRTEDMVTQQTPISAVEIQVNR
jgi:antitoxin component YwqK of YwqJK toxin-antitoxin module